MKLYYSPGVCSLAPHIVLRETNTPFDLVKVDLNAKKTEDGRDFWQISPAGYVPALELDDGTVLTEGPAIMQYIADRADAMHLAPRNGSIERYRLQSWLNFVTSELHKGFGVLFNSKMPEEGKAVAREVLLARIGVVDKHLGSNAYLLGKDYTLADAYLFNVISWSKPLKLDLSGFRNVSDHQSRVAARPAVKAAMKAEGLIK